jgi:hypothetical protein
VIAQFLKEHSTTSILALPVGEIAPPLSLPDVVTSLHWKYLYGPELGVTGKIHSSSFLRNTRFFTVFSPLLHSHLDLPFSCFLSLCETKKRMKKRMKKEKENTKNRII